MNPTGRGDEETGRTDDPSVDRLRRGWSPDASGAVRRGLPAGLTVGTVRATARVPRCRSRELRCLDGHGVGVDGAGNAARQSHASDERTDALKHPDRRWGV
ncbi:hypothetical protein BRC93_01255 [Halobacteriales archaeon QS_5_70_15]|nr:MAG: hypothetical protein BRC93_01255 [Halobacteriales archaeon QS_5_70_15]